MKKILCVTLSILMLILVFPTMIFAEETVCTVSKNGETAVGYTSFDSAVASLTAGNTYVIEILDNVSLTGANYISKHADTTINGNGKTLTVSNNDGIFCDNIGMYVLNINDLTINATSKVLFRCNWWNQNATKVTTLNGCTINNTTTDIGDGLFTLGGNYTDNKYTLNLEDCKIKANNESIINMCNQGERVVNITDTTITHEYGSLGSFNTATLIRVNAAAAGYRATINIKGSSNLVSNPVGTTVPGKTNIIYVSASNSPGVSVNFSENDNGDKPTMFINLENKTENQSRIYNRFIADENNLLFVKITGDATYKASAFAATKGVILPHSNIPYYATTGEIFSEANSASPWAENTAGAVTPWTTAVTGNTSDVEFIPVSRMFDTLDGASVRLSNPSGIRFESEIDDRLLAADGVTFGMLLAPADGLTADNFTIDYVTENGYINLVAGEGEYYKEDANSDKSILRAALTGIPVTNAAVNRQLAARAYVTIGDNTYYAAFDGENQRSMLYVAEAALAAIDAGTYEGWNDYDATAQNNIKAMLTAIVEAGENA